MERTRRLRRELSFELARLNGLQTSVDLTREDASTKAKATEIRKQAGVCLHLLDQYQSSMPGQMWAYTETKCRPLRDDLKRTEMLFRDASGEFERRLQGSWDRHHKIDRSWTDFYVQDPALAGVDVGTDGEQCERGESDEISLEMLSRSYIEAVNLQDLDALMDLVDDDVEFKLAFDAPLAGKAAVRGHYERDWAEHDSAVMEIREVFETEEKVALEVDVDCGPPSNVRYSGVIVHHWSDEDRLVRHQLYVDEFASAEAPLGHARQERTA